MIQFPDRIIELMNQPVASSFYTVRVKNIRLTTYQHDVTLSDGFHYSASDLIVGLDMPKLESSVDRELYKITLADPAFTLGASYESGLVGAPVEVRLGLIDYNTGLPELNINHMLLMYKGVVDGTGFKIDTKELGEVTSAISCASPMADLDAVRNFYISKSFLRNRAPNDCAFDQVYVGCGSVNLKWGKI